MLVSTVGNAKYGLTAGLVNKVTFDLDCIIVSKGWPGWAFGAHATGLTVLTIDYSAASAEHSRTLLYSVSFMFNDVDTHGFL